jgi:hypothetical protein
VNWKTFAKSARLLNRRVPTSRVRYRPNLEILEERTVLSPVVFTEVQNQSILTLFGTIGGSDIQAQGSGALTTTYYGTFQANIDEVNGTISFTQTGNDFCAANTGNWAPRADGSSGTAPAIYGLQAEVMGTFLGAIRDFHMNADTRGSALSMYQIADGSFGFPSAQTIAISAGTGTYSHPTLGQGPINFSGLNGPNRAGDGALVDNGNGTLRLTVPIDVSYSGTIAGMSLTLHITGTVVGSATIPVVHLGSGSSPNDYATSVVATQGPVNITDSAATITDASSSTNLTSMTARLSIHPDATQEFLAADVGSTGLTASYNASTGVETISGSASPAVYQSVLRTLTYENDALTPHTYDRVITVTVGDGTNSSVPRTSTVTVYAPAQSFAVTDFPTVITAGSADSITVTAKDGNGNTAPGYTGTVHFTSSDPQATAGNELPADYTFTTADHGVHTFTNVTLKTSGLQSITATDEPAGVITGSQTGISVVAAPAVAFRLIAVSTESSGTPFDVTVVAVDSWGNVDTNYRGTVSFSTTDTDPGVMLPASYTFQAGDAGMATFPGEVTFITPGPQTLIVSDMAGMIMASIDVVIV